MTSKEYIASHDGQIARLEQVMTALAEAQVKTGKAEAKLFTAMAELARSQAETAAATRSLTRQWKAYLNTLRKN